eukprot:scaffold37918_cov133-Skeletonema_dohrnii-CCMP3373.AAC.1
MAGNTSQAFWTKNQRHPASRRQPAEGGSVSSSPTTVHTDINILHRRSTKPDLLFPTYHWIKTSGDERENSKIHEALPVCTRPPAASSRQQCPQHVGGFKVKEGSEPIGDREMMMGSIKLTKLLAASVILSQYVFTCAFTTPFSLRTLSYQHDCVKLRVTTSTSEELAVQNRDGVPEQQTLSSATSQDIVVVDGMPTPILVDSEAQDATNTYRAGLITIGFITLLFASNSPILRSAWESTTSAPPVLLINAAVSVVGLVGVIASSPFLNQIVNDPSAQGNTSKDANNNGNDLAARIIGSSAIAGVELGLWKFLGTTTNIYGLSQTSSDHGAFLIQLTTLIVPVVQGIMGVPIPKQIWAAIGLALGGVVIFTQDPNQSSCASLE